MQKEPKKIELRFAGKLESMVRKDAIRLACAHGFTASSTGVTRNTQYLVAGETKDKTTKKLAAAKKNGTKIISEKEFLGMLGLPILNQRTLWENDHNQEGN